MPVCAVQPASASRLQCWHKQWDAWTKGHTDAVGALASKMEALLKEAQQGKVRPNAPEPEPTLIPSITLPPTDPNRNLTP